MKIKRKNLSFNQTPLGVWSLKQEIRRDNPAARRLRRRFGLSDPLATTIADHAGIGPKGDR